MNDRPEHFRYSTGYGSVHKVYPDSWEVDVLDDAGGLIPHVLVIGPRLPEVSTAERPQWVAVSYVGAMSGQPVCWPVESRLPGPRDSRRDYIYYDEALNFRITINRDGELEIRTSNGPLRIRIQESGGVVRLDTPSTRIILQESDKSVEVHCVGDLKAEAAGNADIIAGASTTVTAPAIQLRGNVTVTGTLSVGGDVSTQGNVTAAGTVIDDGGNTPHHSHG